MLTILSCPKPFEGLSTTLQRNAIQSWLRMDPAPEIILFGADAGVAECAREFGVRHIPDVRCNEFGTPLMSSLFEIGQREARENILCYINADVMLLDDFTAMVSDAFARIPKGIVVGHRWDVAVDTEMDFSCYWQQRLRERVKVEGTFVDHTGIDCFIFPKGLIKDFPDFAIGRPVWDNWLIYWARLNNVPVVDFTRRVTIVHQKHDYSHFKLGGHPWHGDEAKRNLKLAGGYGHVYTIRDATVRLTQDGFASNPLQYYSAALRSMKCAFKRHVCRDKKW